VAGVSLKALGTSQGFFSFEFVDVGVVVLVEEIAVARFLEAGKAVRRRLRVGRIKEREAERVILLASSIQPFASMEIFLILCRSDWVWENAVTGSEVLAWKADLAIRLDCSYDTSISIKQSLL
jgi:hypothetical protein